MPIRLTPAVKVILIACVVCFLVQQTVDQFFGGSLLLWLGLVPSSFAFKFHFWQLLSYAFLHADVMHLFLNLFMLVFIGSEIEALWGTARFVRYYFFCAIIAGISYIALQLFVRGGAGLYMPMVGASGAIYGLLLAYGLLFGERVLLFMMLFPMKAKHFVWILAAVEFLSTIYSTKNGLSGVAHLGGMAGGFGYLWAQAVINMARKKRAMKRPELGKSRRGLGKGGGHLKLVINNEQQHPSRNLGDASNDIDHDPKIWH